MTKPKYPYSRTIYLDGRSKRLIKILAKRLEMSQAEFIRRAINDSISELLEEEIENAPA